MDGIRFGLGRPGWAAVNLIWSRLTPEQVSKLILAVSYGLAVVLQIRRVWHRLTRKRVSGQRRF